MSLTTISATKSYLGITDSSQDTILTSLLSYADKTIKNYLGRSIELETKTIRLKPDEDQVLYHFDYPIISASGLTVTYSSTDLSSAETLTEDEDYFVDYDTGEIEFVRSPMVGLKYKYTISFTCGYSTVPADLAYACIRIVSGMYKSGGGGVSQGGDVTSERLGDYSVSYESGFNMGVATKSITQLLANEKAILDMYKFTYV